MRLFVLVAVIFSLNHGRQSCPLDHLAAGTPTDLLPLRHVCAPRYEYPHPQVSPKTSKSIEHFFISLLAVYEKIQLVPYFVNRESALFRLACAM